MALNGFSPVATASLSGSKTKTSYITPHTFLFVDHTKNCLYYLLVTSSKPHMVMNVYRLSPCMDALVCLEYTCRGTQGRYKKRTGIALLCPHLGDFFPVHAIVFTRSRSCTMGFPSRMLQASANSTDQSRCWLATHMRSFYHTSLLL